MIKKHWLFGECKFKVEVVNEDKCSECIHEKVCKRSFQDLCLNYEFGTSKETTCDGCIHRHTRYRERKDRIPCFKCKEFCPKGLVI